MKTLLLAAVLVMGSIQATAAPCLTASLQDYINLGSTGCTVGAAIFSNFDIAPGLPGSTALNPVDLSVVPIGAPTNPGLRINVGRTAIPNEILEAFVHFLVTAPLLSSGTSALPPGGSGAFGTGETRAALDICPGASFSATAPTGCANVPGAAAAFVNSTSSQFAASTSVAASTFFDVFFDITLSGGPAGSAFADNASVSFGFGAVPEPSAVLLAAGGLLALGLVRRRRKA